MKPNFSDTTKRYTLSQTNGYCSIIGCTEKACDFHHKYPNTKVNNKKFPLFIQSIFNCAPLCRYHHDNYSSLPELKLSEIMVIFYEKWLNLFKKGQI